MSKIKTNQKYRIVAKMLKDIEKADEIFIEACYEKQLHNQMIKYPVIEYCSRLNTIDISNFIDFNTYGIDLVGMKRVQFDRNIGSFTYCLTFGKNIVIQITNEW